MRANLPYQDITVYEAFLDMFANGELLYKDGFIYKTFTRRNDARIDYYETPEVACGLMSRGYRRLGRVVNGKSVSLYAHRLIYALHHGLDELFKHDCIDHINGIKSDNRIENLRGLSVKENTYQAERLGNFKRTYGVINGQCRLSPEVVESIRVEYAKGGISQYRLADKYGITQSHVSNIVNRKTRAFG